MRVLGANLTAAAIVRSAALRENWKNIASVGARRDVLA